MMMKDNNQPNGDRKQILLRTETLSKVKHSSKLIDMFARQPRSGSALGAFFSLGVCQHFYLSFSLFARTYYFASLSELYALTRMDLSLSLSLCVCFLLRAGTVACIIAYVVILVKVREL